MSGLWSILSTYRPNAASQAREKQAKKFGVFEARYVAPGYGFVRPSNDRDAQALYNHIRTVAFWLDASPLLSDLGLPFRAGLDDLISIIPLYGDIASGVLQLYQVWLSFVFGVPINIIGWMFLNVILDMVVGIVPIIGDVIDNLFKSNLRNLALLEEWLLTDPHAQRYHILLMPQSDEFIPGPGAKWKGWFGGKEDVREQESRRQEATTGKVRQTRRMKKDEGGWAVPVQEGLD